jgi:hypothetical protein
MSYNRLKAPDYRETLEEAGFRIRDFVVEAPSAEDLKALRQTKVHSEFARFSEQDLGARHLFFVAEKP